MSETQTFEKIKKLAPKSGERREAVRAYLQERPRRFVSDIAAQVGMDQSMVSKVLHGRSGSPAIEAALLEAEKPKAAASRK